MTAPLHEPTAEAAPSAADKRAAAAGEGRAGTFPGWIAWERLKRDKLALTGGIVVLVLIVIALLAPVITNLLGQDPDTFNEKLIDPLFGTPTGSLGGISGDHLLGVEPVNGRDILARILYGARVSSWWASSPPSSRSSSAPCSASWRASSRLGGLAHQPRDGRAWPAFPQLLFTIALVSVMPNNMLAVRLQRARVRDDPGHRLLRLALHRTRGVRPDALDA